MVLAKLMIRRMKKMGCDDIQLELFKPDEVRTRNKYWLTPPTLYTSLDNEFHFDFDPCPYPKPEEFNSLEIPWGKMNYVNPPFRKKDGGPTAFIRKAIKEQKKGNSSVIVVPTPSYVNLLLESGAELKSIGRVKWIGTHNHKPSNNPSPITCFVLKGDRIKFGE